MMREIRKADFFYPGFEHAGFETLFDRFMTRLFCFAARIGVALYNALSADHPRRRREARSFEG
jgi:hypothetical protein